MRYRVGIRVSGRQGRFMNNIIVGNSDFARLLAEYMEDSGVNVDAFTVGKEYISDSHIMGRPVIVMEELEACYDKNKTGLYLGIGYRNLGEIKKSVYLKYVTAGFEFFNYIHPSVIINKDVEIGKGNVIFEGVVIQKHTVMGDGNLCYSNAVIMHDGNIGSFNTFGAGSVINGYVTVGDCSFVGANATVRNGIKINNHTLVGAAAYVSGNTRNDMVITPQPSGRCLGGIERSKNI